MCIVFEAQSQYRGFSTDLIHRDSSSSPFYNSQETPAQRIHNAARRSIARVHRFSNIIHHITHELDDPNALLTANNGEYLVNISLGTPPFPIVAIADTGSDIIWTQCKPCANCYKQDAPLFDPKSSSTYKTVSCSSNACNSLQSDGSSCSSNGQVCQYQVSYGDQSHTQGDVASETLTLASTAGRPVALPKTIIGCGHDNAGTFDSKGSGIVGLGGGSASLVSQLGSTIAGKFSYCLVPYTSTNPTSTMNFGTNAIVSGSNVVSTPLFSDPSQPTFYFLQLQAISVGSKKIPFQSSSIASSAISVGSKKIPFESSSIASSGGNIIIDSGTTLTLVPTQFLSQLSDAVESQVTGGTKASDPQGFFSLCYVADSNIKVPPVTVHFQGADLAMTPDNIFIHVSDKIMCLAFYANDELSIYGNVAQQNFLIGYDLQKHTISFKPTDCSKTTA
ncbi:Aspartic proteinase CDR1 [Linum perenne]